MRLVVSPGDSLTMMEVLPICSHSARVRITTSSLVARPRTSSTSFILCTGLKKCMPMTRSALSTDAAISVTLRAEVLVAMIASAASSGAAWLMTAFFTASCSETVSTSQFAPLAASLRSLVVSKLASDCCACSSLTLPRRTPSPRIFSMLARAWVNEAGLVSTTTVAKPELAKACAMPVPIKPAPTTTTFSLLLVFMSGSRLAAVFYRLHFAMCRCLRRWLQPRRPP
ncbi:hypothetical protein D3C79_770560 [compost metagenome]